MAHALSIYPIEAVIMRHARVVHPYQDQREHRDPSRLFWVDLVVPFWMGEVLIVHIRP